MRGFHYDDLTGLYINEDVEYSGNIKDIKNDRINRILSQVNDLSAFSEELENKIMDMDTHYFFSPIRFLWYHSYIFPNINRVLEVGSGYGAITRFLAETYPQIDSVEYDVNRAYGTKLRTHDLNNVRVFLGDFTKMEPTKKYDLIIVNGVIEYSPQFYDCDEPRKCFMKMLNHLKKFLSDNGVIVIAIENKIGLKYFNGYSEDHYFELYENINDYPHYDERRVITFSRKELIDIIQDVGFKNIKFTYTFPDYKYPLTIINDLNYDFRFHEFISTPFKPHVGFAKTNFDDRLALETVWKSGLIGAMANSFNIIISNKEINVKDDWIVRKYSMNFKPEYRSVTTLYKNGLVVREKLYKDIQTESVKVDDYIIKKNFYEEQYVNGVNLMNIIYKKLLIDDTDTVIQLLKEWKNKIIKTFGVDGENLQPQSFDAIFRNTIITNNGMKFIDLEWVVAKPETIPLELVFWRGVYNDIIPIKKVDVKHFATEVLGYYNPKTHKKYKKLSTKFNTAISSDKIVFENKYITIILSQPTLNKIAKKLWVYTPETIKNAIRKLVFVTK